MMRSFSWPSWGSTDQISRRTRSAIGWLLGALAIGVAILGATRIVGEPISGFGTTISGDQRVMRTFAGRWYFFDDQWVATVVAGPSPRLDADLPPGFRLAEAKTVEDEIHFRVEGPGGSNWRSLRFIRDDVLVIVAPGEEASWCGTCTPRLTRFNAIRYAWRRMEKFRELATSAGEAFEDWLIHQL